MKALLLKILSILFLFGLFSCKSATPDFVLDVHLNEMSIPDAPAINSYTFALKNGQWLIIGGRIDGLHDHRPDRAYPADSANNAIFLIDPLQEKVWVRKINTLSGKLNEQLQSTNMSFYQDGNTLLMAGGYGWSEEQQNHITFPCLTIVDIGKLISTIKSDSDLNACFNQLEDQRMAVAGGYLGKIDEDYLLVFGNRFDGRYSARPNDKHIQKYTNEIRKFRLQEESGQPQIVGYSAQRDSVHFHRRDYNMLPQVFPDGKLAYTAFSGVFQYERNFPWLYPVNIFGDGYEAVEEFEQQFSHYHSACVSVYRKDNNQMDNLFFGGMARFFPDSETGEIVNDPLVPSVNTISQVTRFADGRMEEAILETKMPGLLGASSNFIPIKSIALIKDKVIDYDKLPAGKTLVGYIYGGLQSTDPNTFLRPTGVSVATNRIFQVYLIKN